MPRSNNALKLALYAAAAILTLTHTAAAQTAKLNAYPSSWNTVKAGSPLPGAAFGAPAMYALTCPKQTEIVKDGAATWMLWGPVHGKLGTGTLASPTDKEHLQAYGCNVIMRTSNPSSSGVGGVDANLETMDNHGHGFAASGGFYAEVTEFLPTAHGSHAGFWMEQLGNADGHGELDFPETYGAADHVAASALHWWPTSASQYARPVAVGNYWSAETPSALYGNPHRYGILKGKTQICTYVDRKEIGCVPLIAEMGTSPWRFLFSVFTDANRKDGYEPATLRISGFAVYPYAGD